MTVPFEKKDPKAIEVIQVVLESIRELPRVRDAPTYVSCIFGTVLRREKKMRDKNGKPIVSLPEKNVAIKYLTFSEDERKIYDALCECCCTS